MPKHKPSERQKQLDFEKLEVNRILKIELLEKLQADYRIKNLLFAIDRHLRNNRDCWPSYSRLAEQIGASQRSVGRHIKMACDQGWLLRESGGKGHNNHYRINWSMVFDAVPITTQDMAIARLKATRGEIDAEKELDRKQDQRRAANVERRQQNRNQPRKRGKVVDGFPAGYSPHGSPTDSKTATQKPKTLCVGRKANPSRRRWNCHMEPHMFRDPAEMQRLFQRAVQLGLVKNTDRMRGEVWALAVHCRKAANPGAMFRTNIESEAPFSKVTEKNEIQAQKEILKYDRLSDVFSETLDEAFSGVT